MRFGGTGGVLALTAMLLAGCGSVSVTGTPASLPITGTPRPVLVTASNTELLSVAEANKAVLPEPAADAPLVQKLVHDLRKDTLLMVQWRGETSGGCKDDTVVLKAGAVTDCVITYEGVQVPWQITVSNDFKESDLLVKYTKKPLKGVLLAEAVHARLAKDFGADGDELRCDELPKVQLVELGKKLEPKCQYRAKPVRGGGLVYKDVGLEVDARRGGISLVRAR
ncbi:hypothetical protein M8C13_33870 [Crossiella sp. SN42]|uniref:hypothetical protein n=1 Tax=Crossiella sp. SN42 TaxID=2944808 RepID=UPI00207C4DE8|nr:hypothetical protein [Crossiella sp. SN42]MCO1580756.1 hypothetical protein [Crossiella sp. SN42]